MNTQELASELGHPDAQQLLSGSLARLAYITDPMDSRGLSLSGSTGLANASSCARHRPPRRSGRFRPARRSHWRSTAAPHQTRRKLAGPRPSHHGNDRRCPRRVPCGIEEFVGGIPTCRVRTERAVGASRWCVFRSSRGGRASMTLAPAGYPFSLRISSASSNAGIGERRATLLATAQRHAHTWGSHPDPVGDNTKPRSCASLHAVIPASPAPQITP
jgi:hypothetical protein